LIGEAARHSTGERVYCAADYSPKRWHRFREIDDSLLPSFRKQAKSNPFVKFDESFSRDPTQSIQRQCVSSFHASFFEDFLPSITEHAKQNHGSNAFFINGMTMKNGDGSYESRLEEVA